MRTTYSDRYSCRPVTEDIPGCRVVLGYPKNWSELWDLQSWGASDVSFRWQDIPNQIFIRERQLYEELSVFDTVFLDSDSVSMELSSSEPLGFKRQCSTFFELVETYSGCFTAAIPPYRGIDILGKDWFTSYVQAAADTGLPIFPVIDRWEPWVELLLPIADYAFVTAEIVQNLNVFPQVYKAATREKVRLIPIGLQEPHFLEKYRFNAVVTPGWNVGIKRTKGMFVFDGVQMRYFDKKDKEQGLKLHAVRLKQQGIDLEQVNAQVHWEINKLNTVNWLEYGQHLGKIVQGSWWLSKLEKAEATEAYASLRGYNGDPGLVEAAKRELADAERALVVYDDGARTFIDPRSLVLANCDNCVVSNECPAFSAGSRCAFKTGLPLKGTTDLKNMLAAVLSIQNDRVQQAALIERLQGNELKPHVSKEIAALFKNSELFHKMFKPELGNKTTLNLGVSGPEGGSSFLQAVLSSDKTDIKIGITGTDQQPEQVRTISVETTEVPEDSDEPDET